MRQCIHCAQDYYGSKGGCYRLLVDLRVLRPPMGLSVGFIGK
jgi:hypothetical protein